MLSQTNQQQLSQYCTQSIQQAQVASQASEPISHADAHLQAALLHQDQGLLAFAHCNQCMQRHWQEWLRWPVFFVHQVVSCMLRWWLHPASFSDMKLCIGCVMPRPVHNACIKVLLGLSMAHLWLSVQLRIGEDRTTTLLLYTICWRPCLLPRTIAECQYLTIHKTICSFQHLQYLHAR